MKHVLKPDLDNIFALNAFNDVQEKYENTAQNGDKKSLSMRPMWS